MARLDTRAALVVLGLSLLGCNGTGTADHAHAEAAREYGTRGVVRELDTAARRITIAHEDVPGYMPGMTMPFELGAGVSIDGIAVGTRIEFRFRPESGGRHVVTSIRKL